MVLSFVEKYCFNSRMHYDGGASIAAAAIGSAVSAGASLGISGSMNKRAAHEARRTRAWQTAEREAQNQWNLEQWNRENEWNLKNNSPAAQAARMEAAGFNPLSVLEHGSDLSPAHADGATDPSGTMPQMFNPSGEVAGAVQSGMDAILRAKQLNLQQKQLDLQTQKTEQEINESIARTEKTYSEKQRIDKLLDGEITLQGVQIDLGKSSAHLNNEQAKLVVAKVAECNQNIEASLQAVRESNARISLMDWNKMADKMRLNNETRLVGARIILMNAQTELTHSQARNVRQHTGLLRQQTRGAVRENAMGDYYRDKYFKLDLENQSSILNSKADYDFNKSSPLRLNLENATALLEPVAKAIQSVAALKIGQSLGNLKMNVSAANPEPLPPSGVSQFY